MIFYSEANAKKQKDINREVLKYYILKPGKLKIQKYKYTLKKDNLLKITNDNHNQVMGGGSLIVLCPFHNAMLNAVLKHPGFDLKVNPKKAKMNETLNFQS